MKSENKIKKWLETCVEPFYIVITIIILLMFIVYGWKVSNEYNRRENIENSIHKLTHQVDSLSIEIKTLKGNVTK